MAEQKMESIVICPSCNEQVYVVMEPFQDMMSGLMQMFKSIVKSEHFEGSKKCKCGKLVRAALTVTAEE